MPFQGVARYKCEALKARQEPGGQSKTRDGGDVKMDELEAKRISFLRICSDTCARSRV